MIRFQVAGSDGGYLLEQLLLESIGAARGGGIFAWANVNGVRSLLEDDVFGEFLDTGIFRLIVGTDSITDIATVDRLIELSSRRNHLEVRAFVSPSGSLFHPKMAWFEHDDHLSLIVGSGNLTMGGLRSNWEAFVILKLVGKERMDALAEIDRFLMTHVDHLFPITDTRVREQVSKNIGNERSFKSSPAATTKGAVAQSVEDVLVAEIPRSDNRWKQANFDRHNYEDFFGARGGSQRRISLYHVDSAGVIGDVESRPGVKVASHNFRFELAAASGIPYPTSGRPIGVFLRLVTGEFIYSLLLPGDPAHRRIDALLATHWGGPAGQMRRIRLTANELESAWPDAPIWRAALPAL